MATKKFAIVYQPFYTIEFLLEFLEMDDQLQQ